MQLVISIEHPQINNSVQVHDWMKADCNSVSVETASIDWWNKLVTMNAEETITCLTDVLLQLVDAYIPKRILKEETKLRLKTERGRKHINKRWQHLEDTWCLDWVSASSSSFVVHRSRLSTVCDRSLLVATSRVWNGLPQHVMVAPSLPVFRSRLKTHLFSVSLH